MKRFVFFGLTFCALASLSFVASAQIKKGKTRLALTKQIMSGLVQANCAALGKGLKEAPVDDKAWDALVTNAALLNEAGHLIMDDGRCPDGEWANASKALRESSAAVLAKLEAKDLAGAAVEFKAVTESCGACHKVHKKP